LFALQALHTLSEAVSSWPTVDVPFLVFLLSEMATDYCLSSFEEEKMVGETVAEFIKDSLDAFEQRVDDMFLSTLDVPYATELSMMKIQKLIELAMLGHDGQQLRDDEQLEVFMTDGEPMPSTIDSWARGTGTTVQLSHPTSSRFNGSFLFWVI
jgi:hypothetical protein